MQQVLMQDFGLEEISVKSRRSPAGFGFDLTALLDDSSATDQQMQSRLQNSASRCSIAATSLKILFHLVHSVAQAFLKRAGLVQNPDPRVRCNP